MPSFSLKADIDSLMYSLNAMENAAVEAARPAAQAAAQVLYDTVKANVARIGKKTGNLQRSIYQAFSVDNSSPGRAVYHVSWNAHKGYAPHGHLVEYGHMQRYEYYQDEQGNVRPKVRPEMQGKPRPDKNASRSVKDAYYVPLPGGPRLVAARPFIRPAIAQFDKALDEAKLVLMQRILRGTKGDKP
jgi:HK97 gp10 family phage protein